MAATKTGQEIINASIPSGGATVTLGPYLVGDNISIGIDGDIVNGATPPASVGLLLFIEYNRAAGLPFKGWNFEGSLLANGITPIRNIKIPLDAYSWRARYSPAPDQTVNLSIQWGAYLP